MSIRLCSRSSFSPGNLRLIRIDDPRAPSLFSGRLRYIPGVTVAYLINPKVACSAVLASMWTCHDATTGNVTFAGNPHSSKPNPFVDASGDLHGLRLTEFLRVPFFSVVRNPYARFVSAYLDKAVRRSDADVWRRVSKMLGLPSDREPAFSTFLDAVAAANPMTLDWHFCPQSVNLLTPLVHLDFLGFLERMDEAEAFLAANGVQIIPFEPHANHSTRAASRLGEFIGPREAAIIQRFYEADFVNYGYSEDMQILVPVRPAAKAAGLQRDELRQLLR